MVLRASHLLWNGVHPAGAATPSSPVAVKVFSDAEVGQATSLARPVIPADHIRHAADKLKLIGCFRPNPTGTVSRAGEV